MELFNSEPTFIQCSKKSTPLQVLFLSKNSPLIELSLLVLCLSVARAADLIASRLIGNHPQDATFIELEVSFRTTPSVCRNVSLSTRMMLCDESITHSALFFLRRGRASKRQHKVHKSTFPPPQVHPTPGCSFATCRRGVKIEGELK